MCVDEVMSCCFFVWYVIPDLAKIDSVMAAELYYVKWIRLKVVTKIDYRYAKCKITNDAYTVYMMDTISTIFLYNLEWQTQIIWSNRNVKISQIHAIRPSHQHDLNLKHNNTNHVNIDSIIHAHLKFPVYSIS